MILSNNPRYIFFGTPDFAVTVLAELCAAGIPPVAIVTNPDRPAGRKKEITPSVVKQYALAHAIPLLQPEVLDDVFVRALQNYNAPVGVLAAYGTIVPATVFNAFPKGIVVVHPSLLPRYRGATPIQSALVAGEDITGTTLFIMDEKVDHGPVLATQHVPLLDSDTYTTLADKLAEASAELLVDTLARYISGAITPVVQNEQGASYTKKLKSEDGFVDVEKDDPITVWRKVRALNPEPGVWTMKDGKRMKILDAGMVDGALIIRKIQFDGGKPQEV